MSFSILGVLYQSVCLACYGASFEYCDRCLISLQFIESLLNDSNPWSLSFKHDGTKIRSVSVIVAIIWILECYWITLFTSSILHAFFLSQNVYKIRWDPMYTQHVLQKTHLPTHPFIPVSQITFISYLVKSNRERLQFGGLQPLSSLNFHSS